MVGDETYGIDRFDGGAGRYDEAFTLQVLFFFFEQRIDECDDLGRFGHAAFPGESACQFAVFRFDDMYTRLPQLR